ncbi:hypothetical protein [Cetobacterium sp.]|uniref:hypothetical protein n=1 Tax=Cetobacterium sp. TaxID=2071632 RepID=UPI003F410B92
MEDFKSKMIDELKKKHSNKEAEKEEVKDNEQKNPVVTKTLPKKKFDYRNKRKNNKKQFNKNTKNSYAEVENVETEFEKFKKHMLEKQSMKELIDYLDFYRESDDTIFDTETLLQCKFLHPDIKIVSIEPNEIQEEHGILAKFWIVKPLYRKEYTDFTKLFGHRSEFPDEFIDYTVRNCVVYPKLEEEQFTKIPSGTVITLHHTIMSISDLNKKFKIIEV